MSPFFSFCAAFVLFAVSVSCPVGAAQTSGPLGTLVDRSLAPFCTAQYGHGTVAVVLADARTGEILAERGADRSIMPASIVKAITTAAALHYMAPDTRFQTTLEASATTEPGGVLAGNLVIRGGGDPTLGSSRVEGSLSSSTLLDRWTSAVLEAGIRSIEGKVIGDGTFFPPDPTPDGWSWDDIGNAYGTGTSGLSFADNQYHLFFRPGKQVGDPAPILRTEPAMPEIQWENGMRTGPEGSGDQGYIYGAPRVGLRWTRGTIPQGKPEFSIRGSIPDPPATLARLLHDRLSSAGVVISGGFASAREPVTTAGVVRLDTVHSPPLRAIIHTINKVSQNLYSETLLLHLARLRGDGSREAGVEAVRDFLRASGVPLDGVALHDGSGLSRNNRVTARAMTTLMTAMTGTPHFELWRRTLPVLGGDGDLKRRVVGMPIAGRVQAKTGYIGGPASRTLSGYLEGPDGRLYAFAFLVNDQTCSMRQVDRDVDGALLEIWKGLSLPAVGREKPPQPVDAPGEPSPGA